MTQSADISCSIAICDGFNLLLPKNQIADVISRSGIKPVGLDDKRSWIAGEVVWRGATVPVLGIEQLVTKRPARLRGAHVAIFRGTTDTDRLPFYAIPLQAIPYPYSVRGDQDIVVREDASNPDFCAMKVTVRGVSALIPNCEALETYLLNN